MCEQVAQTIQLEAFDQTPALFWSPCYPDLSWFDFSLSTSSLTCSQMTNPSHPLHTPITTSFGACCTETSIKPPHTQPLVRSRRNANDWILFANGGNPHYCRPSRMRQPRPLPERGSDIDYWYLQAFIIIPVVAFRAVFLST